ncbi:MAG: DegV family protein [Faecalimonas sp.]|nr:DegV family protein [Faecalimonas sp.]
MREFVISADSTVDLPKQFLEEKQVPVVSLSYIIDGATYKDGEGLTSKEFYDKIREGAMPTTSQVNPEQARDLFEPILKEGKDILHIAFTSGLSGTYNSCRIAAEELSEEYPDRNIVVIDSLCAASGGGLLLYKALELKEQGKSFDEIATWVEENKLHVCHDVTVDDLFHLHRGGRVSKTSAVLGTIIKIKPIIHVNDEGKLIVIGKERGRKKALQTLVERMAEKSQGFDNDIVMITHGDALEDAEYVKGLIQERFGITNIMINPLGTVIGSHTGPGVISIFYMGNRN